MAEGCTPSLPLLRLPLRRTEALGEGQAAAAEGAATACPRRRTSSREAASRAAPEAWGAWEAAAEAPAATTTTPSRVAKTIFVDGVPLSVSEETLATFFSMCGAVFAVRLTPPAPSGDSRRAWVEFEHLESARLALQYDSTVMGGSTLRVSASRSQIHTNGLRETVAPPEGVPLGLPRPAAEAGGRPRAVTLPRRPPPPLPPLPLPSRSPRAATPLLLP